MNSKKTTTTALIVILGSIAAASAPSQAVIEPNSTELENSLNERNLLSKLKNTLHPPTEYERGFHKAIESEKEWGKDIILPKSLEKPKRHAYYIDGANYIVTNLTDFQKIASEHSLDRTTELSGFKSVDSSFGEHPSYVLKKSEDPVKMYKRCHKLQKDNQVIEKTRTVGQWLNHVHLEEEFSQNCSTLVLQMRAAGEFGNLEEIREKYGVSKVEQIDRDSLLEGDKDGQNTENNKFQDGWEDGKQVARERLKLLPALTTYSGEVGEKTGLSPDKSYSWTINSTDYRFDVISEKTLNANYTNPNVGGVIVYGTNSIYITEGKTPLETCQHELVHENHRDKEHSETYYDKSDNSLDSKFYREEEDLINSQCVKIVLTGFNVEAKFEK